MNTLDMYTRQIINQIYIAQLYRNAENYRLLRDSQSSGTPVSARARRKRMLIAFVAIALFGSFLVASLASS
jgi:hypothetical protein